MNKCLAKMKAIVLSFSVAALLLSACQSRQTTPILRAENSIAKNLLQGIWLDDESESVQFRIKGDTIYYPEASYTPVFFKIINDTLFLYGTEDSTSYKIDKQSEYSFWFHSLSDEVIKLHKSENELDSLAFENKDNRDIPIYDQVAKKDSVMYYGGKRYRGYVYINPSRMKVTKTTYTETGMGVENIYYDNIIHICVYEGRKCLYAKDFNKKDFGELIPSDFIKQDILSDMDFVKITAAGFGYQATLCIPEEASCYNIDITISHDGNLSLKNSVYP